LLWDYWAVRGGKGRRAAPCGTGEVYGHGGQPLWLGKELGEPRPLNDVK